MGSPRNYVRFAALGDSVTYGIGDRASQRCRGWARLLSDAIAGEHDVSFCNVARPGATAADLRHSQLGDALEHRPQLASLIVGLNDAMRSTWDPMTLRADLLHSANSLAGQGATLLTVRFHDHSRIFGLPRLLGRPTRRRIDLLNDVYDEIQSTHRGLQVDLAQNPGVYDREFWSMDRLHPSELGHRALAREFSALLELRGLSFESTALELNGDPTTWVDDLHSLVIEGIPWVARRVRDLSPSLGRGALQRASRGSPTSSRELQLPRGSS